MGRKLPNTPRSRIRAALRQLWLRSRERAAVLKKHDYRCANCNCKQSRAKGKKIDIQVHHVGGIDVWNEIIDLIAAKILEAEQVPLCKLCHTLHHQGHVPEPVSEKKRS